MLKAFGMENANAMSTPNGPTCTLEENKETGGDILTSQDYVTAVGKLLNAAHMTHPNILYAVITLTQFTKNPSVLAGGAVVWSSNKQSTRALSTAKVEYVAATHMTKQVL